MAKRSRNIRAARALSSTPKPAVETIPPRFLYAAAALCAVLPLVVYTLTLYRSLPGGDGGELITVAANLGIAHPPGYPLYTLLGKAFSELPFGPDIAWRVNWMSAVTNSLAALFLFLTLTRWTSGSLWAALTATGLFSFSPLVWRYAVGAEVFGLNNFFVCLLLYLLGRLLQKGEKHIFYWLCFVIGLSLSHHHTIVFVSAPVGLWALHRGRQSFVDARSIGVGLALFALGLLPYAYLPIAGSMNPAVAWGNPSTWDGFWTHVLRAEYGTFQLGADENAVESSYLGLAVAYLKRLMFEALFVGLPVAVLGVASSLRSRSSPDSRSLTWLSLVSCGAYLAIFHALSNIDIQEPLVLEVQARFWQLPNIFVFAWIGLGLAVLFRRLGDARGSLQTPLVALVAVVAVACQIAWHYADLDESDNDSFERFGRAVLEPLARGSLLITGEDFAHTTILYQQYCNGFRTDLRVVNQNIMTHEWAKRSIEAHQAGVVVPGSRYLPGMASGSASAVALPYSMSAFLEQNLERAPVYIAFHFRDEEVPLLGHYAELSQGLASLVVPKSELARFDFRAQLEASKRGLELVDPEPLAGKAAGSWERMLLDTYAEASEQRDRIRSVVAGEVR